MKITSIEEDWISFAVAVLPPDVHLTQFQEMQKAFYAGAWTILCKTWEISDDSISEAEGAEILKNLTKECRKFQKILKESDPH